MDKTSKREIISGRDALKYNVNRAYFGKLTGAALVDAYAVFKHSQKWDNPIRSANVLVGNIDGGVICRALWYEMSYNPMRFGNVSPFKYDGDENIFRFCRGVGSQTFSAPEILEKIRCKLIGFMMLNSKNGGQWYDKIDAQDEKIAIKFVDGHSDDNYKKLSLLRESIKIITAQNMADFKISSYRVQMLNVIATRHPNGNRDAERAQSYTPKTVNWWDMGPEELEEERVDKALESAQITMDNRKYVPYRQYSQARADIKSIVSEVQINKR